MRFGHVLLVCSFFALFLVIFLSSPSQLGEFVFQQQKTLLKKDALSTVLEKNPDEAFISLQEQIKSNPALEDECHDIVHEIGHTAYEKYGLNESFNYQNDLCGSGYIHGVIEKYFEDHKGETIDATKICSRNDGRCFHGVGHGLMFNHNYDLQASVKACMKLSRSFAISNCTDGVFMQYFSTGNAKTVNSDAFTICTSFESFARGSCFFYGPRYHLKYNDLIDKVHAECKKLRGYDRDVCMKGMGSGMTKFHISDLKIPENFCFNVEDTDQESCVSGMLSYYIVHFNSYARGKDVCDRFLYSHKDLCEKAYGEMKTY